MRGLPGKTTWYGGVRAKTAVHSVRSRLVLGGLTSSWIIPWRVATLVVAVVTRGKVSVIAIWLKVRASPLRKQVSSRSTRTANATGTVEPRRKCLGEVGTVYISSTHRWVHHTVELDSSPTL